VEIVDVRRELETGENGGKRTIFLASCLLPGHYFGVKIQVYYENMDDFERLFCIPKNIHRRVRS
jgi:hypothetical protein